MRHRTTVVFLLVSAAWGTAFMATKVGLRSLPPALFAAVRFTLAAALLFALASARSDRLRPHSRAEWVPILTGGVFTIGVHHAFLFTGQQYVESAVAAVLLGLVPVITPALTRLTASAERLTPVGAVGVTFGFVGVVVIANPDPSNLFGSDVHGVALVLASAVAFALGAVLTHDAKSALPLVSTQAWMMLVGAVFLHVTTFVLPWESYADAVWTLDAVAALAYLSVVAGAGGFLLYFWLLDRIGPVEVSLLEYVIPVFAAIAGWVALGETLTVTTVVGFASIFVGFVLVKRGAIRAELRRMRTGRWVGTNDAD
ncbi:Permease of the drug/metabolite transporter (DMT) superfamily [Halopelagius inordinatus]|uniref:Permease of the drug/metabolite transporter (DMT) superfamily n=1 Tax=Halopelagius inordinatus TaxID=553467 RepID=A0A1I2LF58_9EURY|nr:DMT family transporter [Halopelagius inordinatus]SFF77653.1 Permease of the drug/metabolite transporter (DMT) superfamily [Halopelagius inordinatus]